MMSAVVICHTLSKLFFYKSTGAHNLIYKRFSRVKSRKLVPSLGARKRVEVLHETNEDTNAEVWDELEASETDFMNLNLTQREHEREMAKRKHALRVMILQKKYFKESREPSLLTWEEREQICHLHKLNPEKWNVDTLAESFPATGNIIEKILKSDWKQSNAERIIAYNKSVEKNWKLLYEGKLDISREMKTHLLKFAKREKIMLPPIESHMVTKYENTFQTESKEFSDIVNPPKSNSLLPDPAQDIKDKFAGSLQNIPEDETYVIEDKSRKSVRMATLDMYRKQILKSCKNPDAIDKAIIDGHNNDLLRNVNKQVSPNDFSVGKYDKQITELECPSNKTQDWIKIPHYLKRKGSLYKLNDCYYDDDGELLYRVPGMG